MPLPRPILDDRTYSQIRDELIRRIPVYTPEWTDHNASDPGITLIELFSFLGENLLYRFNQIPETTRLEFLRLLQVPLRPAQPANALLTMTTDQPDGVLVPGETEAKAGSILFETQTEVRVLPVSCLAMSKSASQEPNETIEPELYARFERIMDVIGKVDNPEFYTNKVVPGEDGGEIVDFDQAVDGRLWVAVLNELDEDPATVRNNFAKHREAPLLLNLGFVPDEVPADLDYADEPEDRNPEEDQNQEKESAYPDQKDDMPDRHKIGLCPGPGETALPAPGVTWEISTGSTKDGRPQYEPIQILGDSTRGLSQEGVVRLALPTEIEKMGTFDLDDPERGGTGDLPPVLDDENEAKVLFWLRAFRPDDSRFGKVRLVEINATAAIQSRKARTEFLGTGTAQPGQTYQLIHKPVIKGSLVLEVEGPDGWQRWHEVDGFHTSRESSRHFLLDRESGEVRFGGGWQGYAPQIGERIRARHYRYGGGVQGNVPAGSVAKLSGVNGVEVTNPLNARGGEDPEPLEKALERIPGELRRRDRAVTIGDFKELAILTPGADVGRADCLARFHPHRRDTEAAGVISVVAWPREDARHPNAPMPSRNLLRRVCCWLDQRRLVTTELYVIPPRYRKIAVSVGLKVLSGYGIDAVRRWVELVLRQYLAPLPPYGPSGEGWPLGRRVHGPELEAAALQVEGVEYLEDLQVARPDPESNDWIVGTVELELDEVPELDLITVVAGPAVDLAGESPAPPVPADPPVPIPIKREEC